MTSCLHRIIYPPAAEWGVEGKFAFVLQPAAAGVRCQERRTERHTVISLTLEATAMPFVNFQS